MPSAEVLVATPSNTKVLNLWNGVDNDTPPTDWWRADFDDSAWETPVEVTPDAGDTGIGYVATYGLTPMWGATDSASTAAIILTRTHFTAPATVTDGFGVSLVSTDLFNESMQVSSGAFELAGEILDGSGMASGSHSYSVLDYYNGVQATYPGQPPSGPCFHQREVSNLVLGGDNVFAAAINLGSVDCTTATPYGPFSPRTRNAFATWFAWGFRFFDEPCSTFGYVTDAIATDAVKVLRFTGSPPANWYLPAFDDSAWSTAVQSNMGSLRADLGNNIWDGWTNSAGTVSPGRGHYNGTDIFYDPIAQTGFNPDYEAPYGLWATADEATPGESVIMRIRYTTPTLDSIIRSPMRVAGTSNVIYIGTLLARDFAGFSSITSYVNGFGGGSGIEIVNFPQLITLGQENLIALLMTTDSTQLARGYGAWIQLGVQLVNCGPYTPPVITPPTVTRARTYGQVIS